MIMGFMLSQAIAAAAKLGVADLLENGPKTAEELAHRTGSNAGALYRLLRALASVGIFAEDAGRFKLTPLAEPLRNDAPDSLRGTALFLGSDWHMQVWADIDYAIKHGKPAFEHLHGEPYFDYLPKNPERAAVFNDAMTSLSRLTSQDVLAAYDFSAVKKLVDVGGGHGYLLYAILDKYPHLKGVLFDAPFVIDGARRTAKNERCELATGDFFQAVPEGGDAYIMKHIIHDWNDESAVTILRACRKAMTSDGKVLLVENVIPEGNTPSPGKFLDLEMLLFLHSHERTEKQYRELFDEAGFELTRIVPTRSSYGIIEGRRIH